MKFLKNSDKKEADSSVGLCEAFSKNASHFESLDAYAYARRKRNVRDKPGHYELLIKRIFRRWFYA